MGIKQTQFLKIDSIQPKQDQPRHHFDEQSLKELAESIKKFGLQNPISARRVGDMFEIVHGERRWRASKLAGLTEIEAKIIEVDDREAYLLSLIENIQRENLLDIEEMEAFMRLQEEGLTQIEIAKTINKTQSYVAQKLRLNDLPITVKSFMRTVYKSQPLLSEGAARQLLKIKGFIDLYDCLPFNNKLYQHAIFKDWTSWFQDGIAEANLGKPVMVFAEKVDCLRWMFFNASLMQGQRYTDKDNPNPSILLHEIANPKLKSTGNQAYDEMLWGMKYAIKWNLVPEISH